MKKNRKNDSSAYSVKYTKIFDIGNEHGEYNVQATSDTENLFPTISQGFPGDGEREAKNKKIYEESQRKNK